VDVVEDPGDWADALVARQGRRTPSPDPAQVLSLSPSRALSSDRAASLHLPVVTRRDFLFVRPSVRPGDRMFGVVSFRSLRRSRHANCWFLTWGLNLWDFPCRLKREI